LSSPAVLHLLISVLLFASSCLTSAFLSALLLFFKPQMPFA